MKHKASPVRQVETADGRAAYIRTNFGLGAPGALRIAEELEKQGLRLVEVRVKENLD